MKNTLHTCLKKCFEITILLLFLNSCKPETIVIETYETDSLLIWNETIMAFAIEKDGLLTLNGVRTEAMAATAAHNALNAIYPVYNVYKYEGNIKKADPLTAVNQAIYEVVRRSFREKEKELRELFTSLLDSIPDSEAKAAGIVLGRETARQILAMRAQDNWDGTSNYTWHPMAPGVYAEFNEHSGTPEGFVFGAGWAGATPFLLSSQNQFRSPPPPKTTSKEYTKAFQEVKTYGAFQSKLRSKDQTHMALWWKDFVEKSHNKLARELIKKEKLNLWEAARTLALLNMTIYDAYINVFDNKFHYNHWRPYTAIRWAANDENPDTEADVQWNNLHKHTYAFPSYPSAHGAASSAAMRVLSNTIGKGDSYAFTMTTSDVESAGPFSEKIAMDPPTRAFNSFTQAGHEAAISRVYLGIHFRYDSEEGHRLGNSIGDFVNKNFLTPFKPENEPPTDAQVSNENEY